MPVTDAEKIINLEDLAAFKAKLDDTVVHKSGDETIEGTKHFTSVISGTADRAMHDGDGVPLANEDDLWNWQKTETAGLVQFKPVPDSVLEPVVDFMFIETPPASGDKSPDNPSTINGKYIVNLARGSKNFYFLNHNVDFELYGVTFTFNSDGSVTLHGTCSLTQNSYQIQHNFTVGPVQPVGKNIVASIRHLGGSYTLNGQSFPLAVQATRRKTSDGVNSYCWMSDSGADSTSISYFASDSTDDYKIITTTFFLINGVAFDHYRIKIQYEISEGTVPTDFDIATVNEYFVNLGNTYYGGTIDVNTGKLTTTIGYSEISSFTHFVAVKADTVCFDAALSHNHPNANVTYISSCQEFELGNANSSSVNIECWRPWGSGVNGAYFNILKSRLDVSGAADPSNPTDAEWLAAGNAWVASHNLHCVVALYASAVIQLTPTQIKSLPALDKYEPRVNTVYSNAQSVQVGYQRYADEANTVHRTGNEIIEGTKTFVSTINGSVSGNAGTVNGHSVAADVPANAVFTDTTYTDATTTTAGLMSAADKTKLDSVGTVFTFKGTVADSTALPVSGNTAGDAYVAEDDQHVYVWDGSAWSDIGAFDFIPPATDGQIDALFS